MERHAWARTRRIRHHVVGETMFSAIVAILLVASLANDVGGDGVAVPLAASDHQQSEQQHCAPTTRCGGIDQTITQQHDTLAAAVKAAAPAAGTKPRVVHFNTGTGLLVRALADIAEDVHTFELANRDRTIRCLQQWLQLQVIIDTLYM